MDLTAATLADLVRALRSQGRETDKRKEPRVGLRARTHLTRYTGGTPIPARVRDISASGMNLLCDSEFKEGESLTVELGPMDRPQCLVRHCRRVASGLYGVGVQFLDYEPKQQYNT